MKPTHEQSIAKSADRHLAVVANAGSGKTSVLVDRFTALLLNGADIRSIVAITFTKKAAAEMVTRIALNLEKRLSDITYQQDWKTIKRIRERLNTARISTIHSFCARLLREYPIEAGINPSFTEMTEYDAERLKRESIEAMLEIWLESPPEESTKRDAALQFVRAFGRKKTIEVAYEAMANSERFEELQKLYATHDNDALHTLSDTAFLRLAARQTRAFMAALQEAAHAVDLALLTLKSREKFIDAVAEVAVAYDLAQRSEIESQRVAISECLNAAIRAKRAMCTAPGKLLQAFAKGLADIPARERLNKRLSMHFTELERTAAVWEAQDHDLDLVNLARGLMEFAGDAWELVHEEKTRRGELDFDDLQLLALQLLRNPEALTKIRRRISYVMIDEFQDTNQLQYDIARTVAGLMTETDSSNGDIEEHSCNFFAVGDPKQSIYGFRGSDVRVFAMARSAIQSINSKKLESGRLPALLETPSGPIQSRSERERLGDIRLTASFRLAPVIAAFVNRVCGGVMQSPGSQYDVDYEELVCGRSGVFPGTVALIIARKRARSLVDNSEEEDPNEATEEELLAQRLQLMVEGPSPAQIAEFDKNSGAEVCRNAKYEDIAILTRSRAGIDALGQALRARAIPFVIYSGAGYHQRQEILDFRSFILFLQNSNEDIALAAILRSPFFDIDDTELLNISACGQGSLWECAQAYFKSRGDHPPSDNFLRAYSILIELAPLAARLTIPNLVRTILQRTSWLGAVAGAERFRQMEANVRKLLELARQYENRGFKNLYDFAEELQTLALQAGREGEAEVSAGASAVSIMTIHASKGLEFPIVVLYRANTGSRSPARTLADAELGLAFAYPRRRPDGLIEEMETPLYYMAKRRAEMADAAEQKRILYVALTRARDHVLASATERITAKGEVGAPTGFWAMIRKGIKADDLDLYAGASLFLSDELALLKDEGVTTQRIDYDVAIHTRMEDLDLGELHELKDTQSPPQLLLQSFAPEILGDVYSASQLSLFEHDRDEFERIYRLGLPPADDDDRWHDYVAADEEEYEAAQGSLAGMLIHAVLERLPWWIDAKGSVDDARHKATIELAVAGSERNISQALQTRVTSETRAVASSEFIRERALAIQRLQAEREFTVPFGRNFLTGVFDALVAGSDDTWEIWDWKTNQVASARRQEELALEYRLQMHTYLYLLWRAFPAQKTYTARLLFTRQAAQSESAEDWIYTYRARAADLRRIESRIESLIAEIRSMSYGDVTTMTR